MTAPSLDHLRTFVTVSRTGSLRRAAQLLGVSQPTVSSHIQTLEKELGFALFTRDPGGVTLTAKGEELAQEVGPHLDAIEDVSALSGFGRPTSRPIHIGGAAELLSTMVLPNLAGMQAAVGAPLRFVFGLADDLLDQLASRSVDIVVSAVPPRRRGVTAAPLYDEEFVLVATPEWAGTPLDALPLIAYAENLPIVRRYWRSVFGTRPTGHPVVAVIPDLRGIRSAVLSGAGASVLPRYLVDDDLAAGALVDLDEQEVAPLNTLYLATRGRELERDAALGAVAAQLRHWIREAGKKSDTGVAES